MPNIAATTAPFANVLRVVAVVLALHALSGVGQAGEVPLPKVFVAAFRGDAGETTARLVRRDLERSGVVELVAFESSDAYGIHAEATGGWIDAVIFKPGGRVLFQRRYESPNLRQNVHRMCDDFTEIVTRQTGIAGSVIAFVSDVSGQNQIYICDSDGEDVRQVTTDPDIAGLHPHISLTNSKIVYTTVKNGYADIWSIDLVTEQRKRLINAPGDNRYPALSPDGERLAITMSYSGTTDLYVTTSLGGRGRRLTDDDAIESHPSWSPDGRHIAFSRQSQDGRAQVCYISSLGGEISPISKVPESNPELSSEPDWSPDGKRIAFATINTGYKRQISIFDVSTRKISVIPGTEGASAPHWAPDSHHLVYLKDNALWVVDLTRSSQQTKILDDFGNVSEPAWSR